MGAGGAYGAERLARAHRLPGRDGAGRVGETAGGIRAGGHAAPGPRPRARHVQAAVTSAAPRAGDARPGELLARRLWGSAQGPARSLPEALLARESARGAAHTRRATQGLTARVQRPLVGRCTRANRGPGACRRAAGGSLLAVALHLFLGRRALLLAHFQEALALAGVLALTRVVGALAGRLTLAGVHAGALALGLGTRHGGADQAGAEEHGGGGCDGQAGAVFQSHWCIPRAVKDLTGRRPGRALICHAAAWPAAARVSTPSPNRRCSQ